MHFRRWSCPPPDFRAQHAVSGRKQLAINSAAEGTVMIQRSGNAYRLQGFSKGAGRIRGEDSKWDSTALTFADRLSQFLPFAGGQSSYQINIHVGKHGILVLAFVASINNIITSPAVIDLNITRDYKHGILIVSVCLFIPYMFHNFAKDYLIHNWL